MPALIPALGSAAAQLAGFGLSSGAGLAGTVARGVLVGGAISSGMALFDPATRTARYAANKRVPNALPDPEVLLANYYANKTSYPDLVKLMAAQGFDIAGESYPNSIGSRAWEQAVELAKPQWGFQEYLKWWRQGRINFAQTVDTLSRRGFTDPFNVNLWLYDYENLPIEVIRNLFLLGEIDEQGAVNLLAPHGHYGNDALRIISTWRNYPGVVETIALLNRGVIPFNTAEEWLRANGLVDDDARLQVLELKNAIPSPSDLIHFAVREAWDDNVSATYGYDAEFPQEFRYWAGKQGLDWSEPVPMPDGSVKPGKPWPQLYWRSHWRAISPEQAYVALHRFRGDPANPATWRVPGVRPFTATDVDNVLKIADYPAGFRSFLREMSYLPMRLVDIRNAHFQGVIGIQEVYEQFQDRGSNPRTAQIQADLVAAQKREREDKPAKLKQQAAERKLAELTIESYRLGTMERVAARTQLENLGYRLTTAELVLDMSEVGERQALIRATMSRARSDYFSGRINYQQLIARLKLAGMTDAKATFYADWYYTQRGERRVFASTAKLLDWFRRGLISSTELNTRLTNLGWEQPDALTHLASAQQDVLRLFTASQERAAAKAKAASREVQRAIEESQRRVEQMQATLRRLTPVGTMKRWLKDEQITETEYFERMRAMGYTFRVASEYYEEVMGHEPGEEHAFESAATLDEGLEEESPETPQIGTAGGAMPE